MVSCSGYFCSFTDCTVRMAMLNDVILDKSKSTDLVFDVEIGELRTEQRRSAELLEAVEVEDQEPWERIRRGKLHKKSRPRTGSSKLMDWDGS